MTPPCLAPIPLPIWEGGDKEIMVIKNWARPIDFFARCSHYIDHMAPVWLALDEEMRGSFYVPALIREYAISKGLPDVVALRPPGVNNKVNVAPPGDGPLVTCAYGDLQTAVQKNPKRPQIFMEHGVSAQRLCRRGRDAA
jgi:hypothetical protein